MTPGRYVGAEALESHGEPSDEKMTRPTATGHEQMAEGRKLDATFEAIPKELAYGR